MSDSQDWIIKTDPHHYLKIQVTSDLEITESITMMDRLRQSIRKLSFSFAGGNRRKSSTITTTATTTTTKINNRPVSYHPASPNNIIQTNSNMHRLSQPSISKQPSYSTSLLPHATSSVTPTVSLSTGHTLIFNGLSSSNIIPPVSYQSDEEEEDIRSRPDISRRVSSSSSSSGLGLTFGRYRGGMTPIIQ